MTDQVRLSSTGPGPNAVAIAAEWQKLITTNLPQMRSSATRWRDGLGALVTIVTTGLVIAGPENMVDLPAGWRCAVVGLMVGGLLVVLAGLFFALCAAAGRPRRLTYEVFAEKWQTVRALDANDAQKVRRDLLWAQWLAVIGMLAVVLGTGTWLLSPEKLSDPAAQLLVTTATERLCGTLDSGDQQKIVLSIDGEQNPAELPYLDVVNMQVIADCSVGRSSP